MNNVGKFSFADEKDSLNSLLHQQLLGLYYLTPVLGLSFPSSIKSSHTPLHGVCASKAVLVVTVTTFFPA